MQRSRIARVWPLIAGAVVVAALTAGCVPENSASVDGPSAASSSSGRDATIWPFATTSPWNTPLGSGATFDAWSIITTSNSTPWINRESYSLPVVRASASDPLVTINATGGSYPGPVTLRMPASARASAGTDAHLAVIAPDGLHANEFWDLDLAAGTAGTNLPVDLTGPGVGLGWVRGTGVAAEGGLIRQHEMTSIPHALGIALPYSLLANGHVWPAISDDGGSGTGFVPEGSLLAIPPGTPRPSGLSPLANAIFDALSRYGAYVEDTSGWSGAVPLSAEPSADPGAVDAGAYDMGKVLPLLRRVTNNTPSTVGGPGARLAPWAPAI